MLLALYMEPTSQSLARVPGWCDLKPPMEGGAPDRVPPAHTYIHVDSPFYSAFVHTLGLRHRKSDT